MARRNKKKKRGSRGSAVRKNFGQITYWYETSNWPHVRRYARDIYGSDCAKDSALSMIGRFKAVKRMFPSYEDALAHLTAVTLGFIEEDYPWISYRPWKVLGGYRLNGKKKICSLKIIEHPDVPRARMTDKGGAPHERPGLGRAPDRSRLYGEHRNPLFSVRESLALARYYETASYAGRRSWPSSGLRRLARMGRQWPTNRQISGKC